MIINKMLEKWFNENIYKFNSVYSHTVVLKFKSLINDTLKFLGVFELIHILITKLFSKREKLSKKFIKGEGIEIGAMHLPLKVYKAKVIYVDRMDIGDLRKHYPELRKFSFVKVNVIDDGETLKKIKSESQDFVIANHFIEHCENPIMVLKNHLRILKRNGIIYWIVPDKRYTFDYNRNLTTLAHINKDFKNGGKYSRKAHYDEWVEKILSSKNNDAVEKSKELMNDKYSIHFHVWSRESFIEFLLFVKKTYKFPFIILEVVANINEFIVILKKI